MLDQFQAGHSLPLNPEIIRSSSVWPYFKRLNWMAERIRIEEIVRAMARQGLVTETGSNKYALTSRAQLRILKLPVEVSWDGKWRLVMIEASTKQRAQREKLIRKLLQLGMVRHGHNTLIYPHGCLKQVRLVADPLGLTEAITYIEAGLITNLQDNATQ